ncbi:MAG: VanZ family protein [Blastocatellia bacterium]
MMNKSNMSANSSFIIHRSSFLTFWGPPLLLMAAIFFFSTDNFSGRNTGSIFFALFHAILPGLTEEQFRPFHFLIRKAGHFTEYGLLALLLFRAFRSGSAERWRLRWALLSLAVVVIYALSDEYHQSFTATREASVYDSMLDASGGATALLVLGVARLMQGRRENRGVEG